MGQTLNHGVYLPAEGERNCYSGLASNWNLLDTAIGDIAGKASATHTHGNITNDGKVGTTANKPLITGTSGAVQAGSFGTSANTFCEGNDSRLSDARTPVAHTHGKADITDLLNSNFIPSANNSYDLGSSSYQWNNIYSKGYYYNGVAWGLDKVNVWTNDNTFKGNIYQNQGDTNFIIPRGTNTVKGDLTTSGKFTLMFKDKNNGSLATSGISYLTFGQNSSGSYATIGAETIGSTDNARHTNSISLKIDPSTNDNTAQFYPVNNNATDLGTSTNKWKSLNGVNPGALSLPKTEDGRYSLTELSSISGISVDNWTLDGSKIVIDANLVITGWLYVSIACGTDGYVVLSTGGYSYPNCFYKVSGTSIGGFASAMIPVVSGIAVCLYLKGTSVLHARYYPAAGNV